MLLVTAFALWRGGAPERSIAVANVVASLASGLVEDRQQWFDPQWGVLAVDLLFLAVLVGFALTANRAWTLFASAFQLLGVVTHAAMMADHKVSPWAYITAGVIWSYLVLIALAVGTWRHARRRPPSPAAS